MAEEALICKALTIMDKADGPIAIDYLSNRLNIPDYHVYEILLKLSERGLVTRRASLNWSKSMSPRFEISLDGRLKIKSITEKVTEVIAEFL